MENSAPIDMIRNLPDELLSHILSFLPTKLAFCTSLLSKRWAPLCYSLTVLHFEDGTVKDYDSFHRFCNFVDTFMLSPRVLEQSLKTFSLKCRFFNRQSFDAWIEAAKQRRVEEFHLTLNVVTLSSTVFISSTLVVLKLERLKVEAEIFCVDLPSLKTLHLKFVCFESPNYFMKLLNACPILQEMRTSFLIYTEENKGAEEFKSLFLSKLVRANIASNDVLFNAISNVKFLHIINHEGTSFEGIPMFRNLIHIELWLYGFFYGWVDIVKFLQHCPKLEVLLVKKGSSCLSAEWKSPISAPRCVSYHLRSCTILSFDGSKDDIGFATYILQNARHLQVMTINGTTDSSNGMKKPQIIEELSSCPRISPGCKLSIEFK